MGKMISISGTHCTGKTTLLNALASDSEVKKMDIHWFKSSGRDLVKVNPSLKINEAGDFRTQFYILSRDIHSLLEMQQYPLVICDRSFIDTFIYSMYLTLKGSFTHEEYNTLYAMYREASKLIKFDKVFLLNPSFGLVNEEDRSMNRKFQEDIQNLFYENKKSNWEWLPNNLDERVKRIKQELVK